MRASAQRAAGSPGEAAYPLGGVCRAVSTWRELAKKPGVDMIAREIESFEPAFEHQALSQARRRVGGAS